MKADWELAYHFLAKIAHFIYALDNDDTLYLELRPIEEINTNKRKSTRVPKIDISGIPDVTNVNGRIMVKVTNEKALRDVLMRIADAIAKRKKKIHVYFGPQPRKFANGQFIVPYARFLVLDVDFKGEVPPWLKYWEKVREYAWNRYELELPSPLFVVMTGHGYHIYYLFETPVSKQTYEVIYSLFAKIFGADPKTKDIEHIFRVAGTINFKNGERKFVNLEIDNSEFVESAFNDPQLYKQVEAGDLPVFTALKIEELYSKARRELEREKKRKEEIAELSEYEHSAGRRTKLDANKKKKIVEMLSPYWREGVRHHLALAIAGLFYHKGIPITDTFDVIISLALANDDKELEDRLRCVIDTYRAKTGLSEEDASHIIAYFEEKYPELVSTINKVVKQQPRSVNVAYTTYIDVVAESLGDIGDEFRKVVNSVKALLKPKTEYVVVDYNGKEFLIDYEKHEIYIKTVKRSKKGGREELKLFFEGIPVAGRWGMIPILDIERRELVIERRVGASIRRDTIVLLSEGWSTNTNLLNLLSHGKSNTTEVFQTLFKIAERLGKVKYEHWTHYGPGYYPAVTNGRPQIISHTDLPLPSPDELREAIKAEVLAQAFYERDWFRLTRWFTMAPFNFVVKGFRINSVTVGGDTIPYDFIEAVYLHGEGGKGKSEFTRLWMNYWKDVGLTPKDMNVPDINSEASFGVVVSRHTYPVAIQEADKLIAKMKNGGELVAVLKNAVENLYVRERISPRDKTTHESIPALALPIITSNRHIVIPDTGFARRFIIYTVTQQTNNMMRLLFTKYVRTYVAKRIHAWGHWFHYVLTRFPEVLWWGQSWDEVEAIIRVAGAIYAGVEIPEHYLDSFDVMRFDFDEMALARAHMFLTAFAHYIFDITKTTIKESYDSEAYAQQVIQALRSLATMGGIVIKIDSIDGVEYVDIIDTNSLSQFLRKHGLPFDVDADSIAEMFKLLLETDDERAVIVRFIKSKGKKKKKIVSIRLLDLVNLLTSWKADEAITADDLKELMTFDSSSIIEKAIKLLKQLGLEYYTELTPLNELKDEVLGEINAKLLSKLWKWRGTKPSGITRVDDVDSEIGSGDDDREGETAEIEDGQHLEGTGEVEHTPHEGGEDNVHVEETDAGSDMVELQTDEGENIPDGADSADFRGLPTVDDFVKEGITINELIDEIDDLLRYLSIGANIRSLEQCVKRLGSREKCASYLKWLRNEAVKRLRNSAPEQ